jgi:hypothetical protein
MNAKIILTAVLTTALIALNAGTALGADPDPGNYRSITSGNWEAASTWEVEDSGSPGTYITAVDYPRTGDSANVRNGHTVGVTAAVNVATLDVDGGGTVNTSTNTLKIENASGLNIDASGMLDVSDAGVLQLDGGGTHTNAGTIELSISNSRLNITSSSATISGTDGIIDGVHNSAKVQVAADLTLTVAFGQSITGRMELHGLSGGSALGKFDIDGIVDANVASETMKFAAGTFEGSGTIKATNSDSIVQFASGGTYTGLATNFVLSGGGDFDVDENVSSTGGFTTFASGSKIEIAAQKSFKVYQP